MIRTEKEQTVPKSEEEEVAKKKKIVQKKLEEPNSWQEAGDGRT